MTTHFDQWLPTGLATRTLGVSADTLKRYADQDQFLIEGQHWRRGPFQNSPRVWHVQSCLQAMSQRGRTKA